jgi:hypothetical protein
MPSQEWQFKQDYSAVITAFNEAFPNTTPPEYQWIFHWLGKYPVWAVRDAIQTLSQHPLRDKFTTTSIGKAISALLRVNAMKRAVSSVSVSPGGAK